MINKEQFGKRIALLRKKNGISQAELAEKFNISSQAVSKLFRLFSRKSLIPSFIKKIVGIIFVE